MHAREAAPAAVLALSTEGFPFLPEIPHRAAAKFTEFLWRWESNDIEVSWP